MPATWDVDQALIADAQQGNRSALDQFVRRHERWLRGVIYATLGHATHVDDVLQQVWVNVCQQIGTLADPRKWRSWLYRLTRNAAIDFGQAVRRRQKRTQAFDAQTDLTDQSPAPPVAIIARESHQRVLLAIQGLPAIYREPFILRHLEDWSYAQIGETLGMPIDTVETRLVRARRLLREALSTEAV